MKRVLEQYAKHITRILQKAAKQGRDTTHKEDIGIAYYRTAIQTVQTLINAPTPVWVGFVFKSKRSAFDR